MLPVWWPSLCVQYTTAVASSKVSFTHCFSLISFPTFVTILCCFYTWISRTSYTKLCNEINVQYYRKYFDLHIISFCPLFSSQKCFINIHEEAKRSQGPEVSPTLTRVRTSPERCWVKLLKLKPTPCSASLLWPQTTPPTPTGISKVPAEIIWSSSKLWCRWSSGRTENRRIAKSRTSAVMLCVVIQINHNLIQWTQDPNKLIIFKQGSLQVCHIFEPGISLWDKTIFSAMMQKPF